MIFYIKLSKSGKVKDDAERYAIHNLKLIFEKFQSIEKSAQLEPWDNMEEKPLKEQHVPKLLDSYSRLHR